MAPHKTNNPIRHESSPQWPQTSFTAMDRPARSSTPNTCRKRQISSYPHLDSIDEASEYEDLYAFADTKTAAETLTEMAIGHMLIDGPSHRLYKKHVKTVILAFRAHSDGLKMAVARSKESASELELEPNAPAAIGALTIAWYDTELSGHAPRPPRFLRASAETESAIQDDVNSETPNNNSTPAIKTEGGDDEDELVARGVDMFWNSDAMTRLLPDQLNTAVETTFKDTQTLYMVNKVAKQEFEACLNRQTFDLKDAIKNATIAWAILRTADRQSWGTRLHALHNGNAHVFESPEPGTGYMDELYRYMELRARLSTCAVVILAMELQAQADPAGTEESAHTSPMTGAAEEALYAPSATSPKRGQKSVPNHKKKRGNKPPRQVSYKQQYGATWRRLAVFIKKEKRSLELVAHQSFNAFGRAGLKGVALGQGGYYLIFKDRKSAVKASTQGLSFSGKTANLKLWKE